jgi:hypothetical protein
MAAYLYMIASYPNVVYPTVSAVSNLTYVVVWIKYHFIIYITSSL